MSDHCNPSSFDLFQLLVAWLKISMESNRKGRRFLEANTCLLELETDRVLERLIAAYALEGPDMEQQMVQHLDLLRDVRERACLSGDHIQAIHAAYVNVYGGLSLDLPPRLVPIEEKLHLLGRMRRPERTSRTRIALLREALAHNEDDECMEPELAAALHNELGHTLIHDYHPLTYADCMHTFEEAVACHESALLVYTFARYPLQYADACIHLGAAWLQCAANASDQSTLASRNGGPAGAIERAIACFTAALLVYQRSTHPEPWARLQALLGRAYTLRRAGEQAENIERAIAYHELALQVAAPETFPTLWATVQALLGDAYRLRRKGRQDDNFRRAMACYKTAQQVFSQKRYPAEWATIHVGLAFIYQHATDRHGQVVEISQKCAIVCYETALNVYTSDTFPVERASTLLKLGDLHCTRSGGECPVNLGLAARCYREALQIFTCDAFPLEHCQARHKLSAALAQHEAKVALSL